MKKNNYILAIDSANEQVTVGLATANDFKLIDHIEKPAHRASNTMLLPEIDKLCRKYNINHKQIMYVAVGLGPGSFTGVRIGLSSAKGIANALGINLIGICTLDAIAWNLWANNIRGDVYIIADAMRKEVYPGIYKLTDIGVDRLNTNTVIKAQNMSIPSNYFVCGDALNKYEYMLKENKIIDKKYWNPTALGLILAAKVNFKPQNPSLVLPIYTRLSDAEEAERSKSKEKSNINNNLIKGVKDIYYPMSQDDCIAFLEFQNTLNKDLRWDDIQKSIEDKNQSWWVAKDPRADNRIIGYCGGILAGDRFEVLRIAVDKEFQDHKIATNLISRVANDMRDLGATSTYLEVRKSNPARKFYEKLGLNKTGIRKNYYHNKNFDFNDKNICQTKREDANIMTGPLPIISKELAGMNIINNLQTRKKIDKLSHPVILSIESSCDETAAAISSNGKIISSVVASQIDFHKRFGGVVPEIASRKHIEAISGLCDACIEKSKITWKDIDAVASTYAPGLVGALVVGMAFAKGCAWAKEIPYIGVNHLEGHIYANKFAEANIELPAIASIISGGNTMLVLIKDWGKYITLGSTIDDAVGEAFDKVSKALGLGYPGGPIISKLAEKGSGNIKFPRAMINSGDYKFSLSGLKTAVTTFIQKNPDANINDICASFQEAVIDVQYKKAKKAIEESGAKTFIFGGGVAANSALRKAYEKLPARTIMSPIKYCGDNAAMIALVANDRYKESKFFNLSSDVSANAPLDIPY